jgi:membrane protein
VLSPTATLVPIPGQRLDPPLKDPPALVQRLADGRPPVRMAWRAIRRFSVANAPLLASGTAYSLLIALLALLAVAYGLIATFGADALAVRLTDALQNALPGLVGDEGIDPDQLRQVGRATSFVGLLLLVFSASRAMTSASSAIHLIYGAPPDPRNVVLARARLIGFMLLLAPLFALSFAAGSTATPVLDLVVSQLGLADAVSVPLVTTIGVAFGFVLDVLLVYLVLSVLGGIRPSRRSRLVGALVGGALFTIIKLVAGLIVSWSVQTPQYGAFAVPVTVLLVLSLMTTAVYLGAAVTAAVAEVHHGPDVDLATAERGVVAA